MPVCDDRYIKAKTRTYDGKVYTNFRGINVLDDDIEFFIVISIDSSLAYKKKLPASIFRQLCL